MPLGVTTNTYKVTAANGATAACSFTVTVVDNQPPVIGLSGLPAAPPLATDNVPEASGYRVVYELDIPVNSNFNNNAIPYNTSGAKDVAHYVNTSALAPLSTIDCKFVF